MDAVLKKQARRVRSRRLIRAKISGTKTIPRLSVYKSLRGVYAQLIDDAAGHTLAFSSSQKVGKKGKNTCTVAEEVGLSLAKVAVKQGINQIVFDRNGWPYHGKIKALAEGARKGGLKF